MTRTTERITTGQRILNTPPHPHRVGKNMRSPLSTRTERAIHPDTLNPHTPRQPPNGRPSARGIQHETSLYVTLPKTSDSVYPPIIQADHLQRQKGHRTIPFGYSKPLNQPWLRGITVERKNMKKIPTATIAQPPPQIQTLASARHHHYQP